MEQRSKKFVKMALLSVALVSVLDACAPKQVNYAPLSSISKNDASQQSLKAIYRIGAGDELEIKFFFAPELNDRMMVRPDGKISIMFAQDIQAAGLTAEELAGDIRAVLAPHVKQLDLVVIVRSFASQRVFVGGEVTKPGAVPLNGSETLLQVLASAGWVTPMGSETVVVVRRDASGMEKIYPVSLAKLEAGKNMEQNIAMQTGDMILVPPSDIVLSDRWVDQNIRQMLPFSPGVGVSYNINGTKQ